jgi:filamentous hemagglutinin
MKLKEIVSQIVIEPSKLVHYALKKNHDKGGDKAIMFEQHLGFTQANYQLLLEQIQAKAMETEAMIGYYDDYGQRYNVDILIVGIQPEQKEIVRTGWLVKPGTNIARLITLYIRSRKNDST